MGGAAPLRTLRSRWEGSSLLWKVFTANAVVFVVAVAVLAWTPVTVHRVATPSELVVLGIGLVLMLTFDLLLLRRAFRPLRLLASSMHAARFGAGAEPGRFVRERERGGAGAGRGARAECSTASNANAATAR